MKKIKELNWYGFVIILLISCAGAAANENVSRFCQWLFLVVAIGLPCAIFFLILGRKK